MGGLRVIFVFACAAAAWPAAAQAVYRCADAGGKVSYQAEPCADGLRQNELHLRQDALPALAAPRRAAWPRLATLTFYYDPAQEPAGYPAVRMEQSIMEATQAWMAGCNVRLQYGGRRPARKPSSPEHVTVRWAPEYTHLKHPADARAGVAGTGSLHGGIALKPGLHDGHMLSVVVHEMGHVLGLPHNHEDLQSVMSYLRDEAARRQPRPSAADYRACNESVAKLFGGSYQRPAEFILPPSNTPPMSDREALEKIHGSPSR